MANSVLVSDRVEAVLKKNKKGDKQFGLRDAYKKLKKDIGEPAAKSWLEEHIDATLKFRELLAREDWVASDTEGTGLGAAAEVVEIAFVPYGKQGWGQFVRPAKQKISAGSESVHGISNEMVEDAPTLAELAPKINKALSRYSNVVFYNAPYDVRAFAQSCHANGIPELEFPEVIDVLPWFSSWAGIWNPKQLGWKYMKLEGGHRAVGDCEVMIEQMKLAASSDIEYAKKLLSGEEK